MTHPRMSRQQHARGYMPHPNRVGIFLRAAPPSPPSTEDSPDSGDGMSLISCYSRDDTFLGLR